MRELEARDALELALNLGVGEVIEVGAGGGAMDVYVRIDCAAIVNDRIERIERIVEAVGLTGRTDVIIKQPTIKVPRDEPRNRGPHPDPGRVLATSTS
ncbi:MAG: hypothetical protein H0T42_09665 [Deltaproteobacteria bacterium]|nr:hypothetical protein [Deltaproteobacteria bacterium]